MKRTNELVASSTIEEDAEEEDKEEEMDGVSGFEMLAGSHRNAVMARMSEYQASLPTLIKPAFNSTVEVSKSLETLRKPTVLKPRTYTILGSGGFLTQRSKLGRKTQDNTGI